MIRDDMIAKLEQALSPQSLEVIDESHLHAGHAGSSDAGETHFRVRMVAQSFDGLSRLQRQRKVFELLADELAGPVHALALKLKTPQEAGQDG